MTHPEAEVLLRYAEGQAVPSAVVAHVDNCVDCQAQLSDLRHFEARLAAESSLDAEERTALRSATERVLAGAARRAPFRRLVGIVAVALAAALLATVALWPRPCGLGVVTIRRYAPDQVVRAGGLQRFSLAIEFAAPRWLGLWQLETKAGKRLLPHADPLLRWLGAEMPLGAGTHRVPAAEVLDFEFASATPPTGLLLVAQAAELSAAELAAIEQLIVDTPRAQLQAAVQSRWPEARVLDFPTR